MATPFVTTGITSLPLGVKDAGTPFGKAIGLATLKRGAKDYLDFLDATKEAFYAYLYHRTGSVKLAETVMNEVFIESLAKSMSLFRLGALAFHSLLDAADKALKDKDIAAADIDTVYLGNLPWLSGADRTTVATMHDALWTLPIAAQRLLIFSLLIGLPVERIAEAVGKTAEAVREEMETAKDLLLMRWQPSISIREKLNSLAFVPGINIHMETQLRFQVVEKYTALRFRRAQWVILGGLFAVLSNVVVASTIAFAVVTQPSLNVELLQLQSIDALLVQRELALQETRQSLIASSEEAKRIVRHSATRNFTALSFATGLKALKAEVAEEETTNRLIDRLRQLTVAFEPTIKPMTTLVLRTAEYVLSVLPRRGV